MKVLVSVRAQDVSSVRSAIESAGIEIDQSFGDDGALIAGDGAVISCIITSDQESWLWGCPGVLGLERVEQLKLHHDDD